MAGRAAVALAAVASLVGCIDSDLVTCGALACPSGNVCTRSGCATPAEVGACDGLGDGDTCRSPNGGIGTCEGGACRTGLCGNCVVDVGEACDDCNQVSGDGCRGDCRKIEACGDLVVDVGEQCDDGNHNPADGCDACTLTTWNVSVAVGMEVAATDVELANPGGIASDGQGRLFIADTDNHRILRVELDGSVTTIAGTGTAGFGGDGGAATSAQLAFPSAVAVDGLGRVLIADTQNARVRLVDVDGTITTFAGTGNYGYGGDGGDASIADLASPSGVAVDAVGRVYVADTDNHRVRVIAIDHTITTIAGDGTPAFGGDGGPATAAQLDNPYGVAIDGLGRLLIADTLNQRVRRVASDGTISTIAGTGDATYGGDGGLATAAQLAYPASIAVDTQGRIAIADVVNERVRLIDTTGVITTAAGQGIQAFVGDGGPATISFVANPLGVAFAPQGKLTIADTGNQRIRQIDLAGTIGTIAGTGAFGSGGDGSAATAALLGGPYGVTVDGSGRIYIADTFGARIRRVELDGTITTVAGTGVAGYSADTGVATQLSLARPSGPALDASGRVYFADMDNQRIRRVELDGTMTTIAGTGLAGFSGDGGPAASAQLWNPGGVAIDGAGRIYIADTGNQRIRRVELDGTITTVAGTGANAYSGDGGPATSASLSIPFAVAIDALGRVIVSDTGNERVRRIELDGTIGTIAGTGFTGSGGDGGPASAAQLANPHAVAIDAQGRIYIADRSNQRIRRIDTDGTIATVAGTGTLGADGDGGPALLAQLAAPLGVAIDPLGRVVIADTSTNRVRRIAADGNLFTVAGQIDPAGVGPASRGRIVDAQAIVVAPAFLLAAGGSSGTLEMLSGASVQAVAGRYPQATATASLARFQTLDFGEVGGVAIDPGRGVIYITETSANRLHVISIVDPAQPATWTIATLANAGGVAGFADGPVGSALFRSPRGLYLDVAARVLYIADTGNHAIRALDLAAGTVTTIVNQNHQLGFGGDGGPARSALLFQPSAITRCPNGDLFVADTGNNRVRRIASGTISTVLGDGVRASSGEGAPATTFPVAAPRGLSCDDSGNLFVSSSTTIRLLPASDAGIVDGSGAVHTIYGAPPRSSFPSSITGCLTGVAVTSATTLTIADACTGLLVNLTRGPASP